MLLQQQLSAPRDHLEPAPAFLGCQAGRGAMFCNRHLPQKGHQGHLGNLQGSGFAFHSSVQAKGSPGWLGWRRL